jgi:hypothetical protein
MHVYKCYDMLKSNAGIRDSDLIEAESSFQARKKYSEKHKIPVVHTVAIQVKPNGELENGSPSQS